MEARATTPHRGRCRALRPWMLLLGLLAFAVLGHAQVRGNLNTLSGGPRTSSSSSATGQNNAGEANPNGFPFGNDTTRNGTDTSATKGLIFHKETPDSVLRAKVFRFEYRPTHVWIDTLLNPSLAPTGTQMHDAIDALNGNYYLGKGALGHPHTPLFPSLGADLVQRMQPEAYEAYALRLDRIGFYQTLTPFSRLTYGSSLDKDHQLSLLHTQNIMPGWNVAFEYRLLNPEGTYTASSALNHYLNATTNYFSADSRLQAHAAILWQSMTFDENGGLLYDSIFTLRLQSNTAGIPVVLSGAGTLQRNRTLMVGGSYSLERQSDSYRERDSLVAVQVDDTTLRLDTLVLVDTIPLRQPRMLNVGVVGFELTADRQKRLFTDSTLWREQTLTLFWTNDAYADYRWHNPLKLTVGLRPHFVTSIVEVDTMRLRSWVDPFARAELLLGRSVLCVEGSTRMAPSATDPTDQRVSARWTLPLDSASTSVAYLAVAAKSKSPDARMLHDASRHQGLDLHPIATERLDLGLRWGEWVDLNLRATHASHHTWYDTARLVHEGTQPFWLLQASLTTRMHLGPVHLDMQQLLQHCTDPTQLPLPLWMSKNSLYADLLLVGGLLRLQTGVDLRYHSPYHAPLYDPQTGLFLQQDELRVGGYLWADVFVAIQVKRASIYAKAGHVNALWETPATYFLLPHYPGQGFGFIWGLSWAFFD